MTKLNFILSLHEKLAGLPSDEVEERLGFYAEMIDDRIEEGLTEEEAVAAAGSVDEIADQILSDIPLSKIAKEKIRPKRKLKTWEIVLIVAGSPIWGSMLIILAASIFSIYAALWAVVVSFWAVFASFAACAPVSLLLAVYTTFTGNALVGVILVGAALVLAGLAIFTFFGCRKATEGFVWLTKKIIFAIKRCFVRKEAEQ